LNFATLVYLFLAVVLLRPESATVKERQIYNRLNGKMAKNTKYPEEQRLHNATVLARTFKIAV